MTKPDASDRTTAKSRDSEQRCGAARRRFRHRRTVTRRRILANVQCPCNSFITEGRNMSETGLWPSQGTTTTPCQLLSSSATKRRNRGHRLAPPVHADATELVSEGSRRCGPHGSRRAPSLLTRAAVCPQPRDAAAPAPRPLPAGAACPGLATRLRHRLLQPTAAPSAHDDALSTGERGTTGDSRRSAVRGSLGSGGPAFLTGLVGTATARAVGLKSES